MVYCFEAEGRRGHRGGSGFKFQVSGFGVRGSGLGSRVSGFGFRVSSLEFRVSGFGFRGEGRDHLAAGVGVEGHSLVAHQDPGRWAQASHLLRTPAISG